MSKPVILLTFANTYEARTYLRALSEEKRQIYNELEKSHELCEIDHWENATLKDVIRLFNEHQGKVAVFHYGGHSDADQLMLEAGDGTFETKTAYASGLAAFFEGKGLKLVFLNGCANEAQVQGFLQAGVGVVIATSQAIYDNVAHEFAATFYGRLAAGASIGEAFKDAEAIFLANGKDPANLYNPDRLREIKLSKSISTSLFPWTIDGSEQAKAWKLSARTETANVLAQEQVRQLVSALLTCQTISTNANRNAVVNSLPDNIKVAINRNDAAIVDTLNIVNTSLNYENGLKSLIEQVRFFEGQSIPMQKVDALLTTFGIAS